MTICLMHWQINNGENCYSLSQKKSPQIDSPVNLDTPPDAISPDEIDRINRQHVHLPKLDDYGFINWMPNINTVERGHRFEEIKSVLELLYVHQKGFHRHIISMTK